MKQDTKTYKVLILGDHYTIVSNESEQHILQVEQLLNSLLKDIAEKSALNDTKKVAVLAALQLSSKLLYAQQHMEKESVAQLQLAQRIQQELSSSTYSSSTTTTL